MTTDSSRGTHRTIVAVFPEREQAREAAEELGNAGYHHTWVAATHPGHIDDGSGTSSTTTVVDDDMLSKMGRFFSGEADASLGDALRRHGVDEENATHLEHSIPAGYAVLTVTLDDSGRQTSDPASVIEACGGRLLTADYGAASLYDFADDRDLDATARVGRSADEERRIRLREERLTVDKQRVASGEAQVRKSVVSQEQSIDVPTYHEELYIERRPVSGATGENAGVITDGETIRVPLTEERVVVEKRPVTTEEVVIGKRRVEDTQRVTETVRKEVLDVDGTATSAADPLRSRESDLS